MLYSIVYIEAPFSDEADATKVDSVIIGSEQNRRRVNLIGIVILLEPMC